MPADAAARAAATSAALSLLQEAVQSSPLAAANLSRLLTENGQALALLPVVTGVRTAAIDDPDFARTNLPPPPVNGALPSAQPVAPATLTSHMPLNTALQHLLDDTDGAIARQTLLQIASLPGQADPSASRVDASSPRWNFEIPFATPQGTAMAQFEISRDGGGHEASGRQSGLAGAFLAQCRTRRPRACAGRAERRSHLGADVGRAARDRLAVAGRGFPTDASVEPRGTDARRYRDPRWCAAAAAGSTRRAFPGPGVMSESKRNQLAVALHYDRTGAPRVVAKGKGSLGAKIIEVARAHDIPIEENEVLAGALSNVELGEEIPAELYKAVAEVLIFVLRLSGRVR